MDGPEEAAPHAAAQPGIPWLGVHALTEFVFCPRAGLIQFEKETDDEGDEIQREPWANLAFMPLYDVRDIDEKLERESRRLFTWLTATVFFIPATCVAYFTLGVWWLAVAFLAYVVVLEFFGSLLRVAELRWLRNVALTAPAHEPDPHEMEQRVNWWELLRAGFQPTAPPGCASDQLRLVGRPWRVLLRGSTRIPVFKKRHCAGPNGRQIHKQHIVRIAAYCRLIEEAVGASSPYGIVLFDDEDFYNGIAIGASNPEARALLDEALHSARAVIRKSLDSIEPDTPSPAKCINCPLGRPWVHRPGETETRVRGVPLPVFAAMGADQRVYHSVCGDRFAWLPPHERKQEKGLKPVA